MLRSFLMACVLVVVPLFGHANPTAETEEMDFLDLVDGEGNVLIQARGVDAVNAEARAQGLAFPALGYWSGGALLCETCSRRCLLYTSPSPRDS